ncbi:H(+)-transporting V1 sector ATPase subunit F [Conoideocrella luteorostrata]|uniref:V-type proton ATPase subunit F n=1 Tax=Conoideocrella luteorostrata TaxID=1105319 RepID=A0AAJ0CZI3_9HYPO|nr:H(+)-transporting V1 sector ATPase subunit F [Conoideocrella luteorostrata]
MANREDPTKRELIAIIGDEDSVTGFLLRGIGHVTTGAEAERSWAVIKDEDDKAAIEAAFDRFTTRKDIAIIFFVQTLAEKIRHRVDQFNDIYPAIIEIPSKNHPYILENDSVMKRVLQQLGK